VATLDEAELARLKHAERLRKMGAHAIEVREGQKGDYAVVAQFKKPPKDVPGELEIVHRGVPKKVALKVEAAKEYRPEAE
jgi:hypothetical protein